MSAAKPKCRTCPYCDPIEGHETAVCRADPPAAQGGWRYIAPDADWCGRHPYFETRVHGNTELALDAIKGKR